MSKHTPGPWKVEHNTAWNRDVDIRGCDGRQIAFACSLNEADAKLIAAAPDLLEACKFIMDRIENVAITSKMQIKLRAAIRKAEGGDA